MDAQQAATFLHDDHIIDLPAFMAIITFIQRGAFFYTGNANTFGNVAGKITPTKNEVKLNDVPPARKHQLAPVI